MFQQERTLNFFFSGNKEAGKKNRWNLYSVEICEMRGCFKLGTHWDFKWILTEDFIKLRIKSNIILT